MKCEKIICVDELPKETFKLFFGDTGGMLRVDKTDYPVLMNQFKQGFSKVWMYTAVDFKSDITGWDKLDEVSQRIFLLNNSYQLLMDAGVVNIYNVLAMLSTNTELKLNYQYIAQNESIHAASYSYGLSQMFGSEAEDKTNIVYEDEFIKSRMNDEVDYSGELYQRLILDKEEGPEAKKILFKAIVATYVLEHIKFPFSFFATWSLNKTNDNAIQGFSMLLKLIAQDELDYHVPVNKTVLKILREPRQNFTEEWSKEFVYWYVEKVTKAEKEWSDYLLKDGEVPGFNKKINNNFIEYFADKTLKDLGLEPLYNAKKTDTVDWYNEYRTINNQNASLQEISNINYNKGVVKDDILSNLGMLREI